MPLAAREVRTYIETPIAPDAPWRLSTMRRDAESRDGARCTAMRMPRAAVNALRLAPRGTDLRDGRFGCPLVAVNEPRMGPRDQRTAGLFSFPSRDITSPFILRF